MPPRLALLILTLAVACAPARDDGAQSSPQDWTTVEDHRNMMRQLGITALRPGPSGNPEDPDFANIDEALANPYPDWPPLLRTGDDRPVSAAEDWWRLRRPEVVEAFEREVVGRIPETVPSVTWSVTDTAHTTLGGRSVVGRQLTGRVDNSAYPHIDVVLDLQLVLPADSDSPVPVMILLGGRSLSQAIGLEDAPRFGPPLSEEEKSRMDPPAGEQLIAAGWGFAYLDPRSIQPDNGAGLTRGIIGLVNRGQPRKPDDWGALRAWSWGAARALDHLETLPEVDATRVGIEGVSRYGKAALVTMAFEPRFAVGLIGSAGEGGVSPYRRHFGEQVENLTGTGGYHWLAGNFLKYGAAEATFGAMDAADLPVDAHMLIALAAPRATFISYGVPEEGDALWLDQQGSYMAVVAASKVFRLLGHEAAGADEHYQSAVKPPVNHLIPGQLAWRQHDGGHTTAPNWRYFIPWAEQALEVDTEASSER